MGRREGALVRIVRAILIDPFACTIERVNVEGDNYRSYYPHLSHATKEVTAFTTAQCNALKQRDAIFMDDEGLDDPIRWFQIAFAHQPFAGKGLIIGADREGESVDAATPIELVRAATMFMEWGFGGKLVQTVRPWSPEDARP